MNMSNFAIGEKIHLSRSGRISLCGRYITNTAPVAEDVSCKRCIQLTPPKPKTLMEIFANEGASNGTDT